jgi:hypothetical protein
VCFSDVPRNFILLDLDIYQTVSLDGALANRQCDHLNQYPESGTEKIQHFVERVQLGTKFSTLEHAKKLAVVFAK